MEVQDPELKCVNWLSSLYGQVADCVKAANVLVGLSNFQLLKEGSVPWRYVKYVQKVSSSILEAVSCVYKSAGIPTSVVVLFSGKTFA